MTRRRRARQRGTPLPTSPLPGGRRENGGGPPLRPTTTMLESPGRAVCASPLKGGGEKTAAARTPLPGDSDLGEPPQNFQMRLPSPAAPVRYHAGGIGEALRSC